MIFNKIVNEYLLYAMEDSRPIGFVSFLVCVFLFYLLESDKMVYVNSPSVLTVLLKKYYLSQEFLLFLGKILSYVFNFMTLGIDGLVVMKLIFGIKVPGIKTKIRKESKVFLFVL